MVLGKKNADEGRLFANFQARVRFRFDSFIWVGIKKTNGPEGNNHLTVFSNPIANLVSFVIPEEDA